MKLYFKYVKILLKSSFEYRLSITLTIIAQLFKTFFTFLGIFLLFERFNNIAGWTLGEVVLCFAVSTASFSIAETIARGFDRFSNMIINGDFDRVMLRPRNTILQVFGSNFDISRVGRLINSIATLIIALNYLNIPFTFTKWIVLLMMIISGTFIFIGIFMLGAAVCFYTVEGLETINIFTDGGREIASYPLDIYNKWLKRFFTFVIPFASFNYLPLMYLVDKTNSNPYLYMLSPLIGIIFLIPCIFIWNLGVKKYLSTGS